jgi:hypothetical protein
MAAVFWGAAPEIVSRHLPSIETRQLVWIVALFAATK